VTVAPSKSNERKDDRADKPGRKPMRKLPTRKDRLLPGMKAEKVVPIENEFDLICHIEFNADGRKFGGYLLKWGDNKYRTIFGFDCDGIHPNLPNVQINSIYDAASDGFKDLPEGELLTIHAKSFVDDSDRRDYLTKLTKGTQNKVLKYIATSELKRLEVLSEKGLRKNKSLRMFATFTYDPDADVKDDRVEKVTKGLLKTLGNFSGAEKIRKSQEFFGFLEASFNAFLLWEQIFVNKMGLTVRPLQAEDLWKDLWDRVNSKPCIPVPQKLIFDRESIKEEINSKVHALSLLINSEESLPIADYRWIRVKKRFTAVMAMLDQPDAWDDERACMNYYWEKLSEDLVNDVEIITQLSKVDQTQVRHQLKDVTKEQIFRAGKAAEEGDVGVAATMDLQEAIEARAALHRGDVALSVATIFLVHRESIDKLDRACNYLESLFLYPANLHREYTYLWKTWAQTFPIAWTPLLKFPYNRQGRIFSEYVLGTVPLTQVGTIDKKGIEFISHDGGVPIKLDLINSQRHMLLLATQRSGKSVVMASMINDFLLNHIPVSIIDYPPTDDASTFKDYTHLLGGAYFDVGKEAANIFELPNIEHLSPEQQKSRRLDYEDFLLEILYSMVMGTTTQNSSVNGDIARSILALVMDKFFKDYEIKKLYREARSTGIGSPAWEKYPTLVNFVEFCSPERIAMKQSPEQIETLNFVVTKLRYWLSSRVGKALSRPSTFAADSQLFVVAMRGVNNHEDAAILSMCAFGTILRRAFSNPKSMVLIDEAAILLQFPALANQVGKLCANGGKAGITVILAAQEPGSIKKCADGDRILGNCGIKLVGRVQPEVRDAFREILYIPEDILSPTMTDSFSPNKAWGYSNWLLLDGRSFTRVRAYASAGTLAAVVNNTHEVARRKELIAAAENPILGLHQYASELLPT
jgi:hypothetical protein